MKLLKILVVLIVVVATIVLATYLFLPDKAYLERSVVIRATPEKVFAVINQLETFNEWSPWYQKDPDAFYTLDGPKTGVGAKLSWKSDDEQVGAGSMTIVASEPESLVRYKMKFDAYPGEPLADYKIQSLDSATRVTWSFEDQVHGMGKFYALGLDHFLGPDYESGLQNLKKYVENLPDYQGDISIQNIDPLRFIGMEAVLEGDEISLLSTKMGQMFDALNQVVAEKGLEVTGPPLCRYHVFTEDKVDFETGIPVEKLPDLPGGDFSGNTIAAGKAVVAVHKGSYENLPETYQEIKKFMKAKHLSPIGDMWEVYDTDASMEPDTSQWITKVYFKIKN